MYIYTPLQKFDREWPGIFARMRGMCESIETYLQMRGAAFRPRIWRSALGGTVGIYIAIRKIRPGIARFFARMPSRRS